MSQRKSSGASPERRSGCLAVFDVPVLVVDPLVLVYVEPHEPDRSVQAHPEKWVWNLPSLAGVGTHRHLGQQEGQAGKGPHLNNRLTEDAEESLGGLVVVAVDAYPVHVFRARPP